MSIIEPDDQFAPDGDLKALLERWTAPGPSRSLERRVSASYLREVGNADPELLHQKDKEEAMKFCSTCQEEYADKFSFCPVDGTPLTGLVTKREESTITQVPAELPTAFASSERPFIRQPPNSNGPRVVEQSPVSTQPPVIEQLPASSQPAFAGAAALVATREEYHLTIMDETGLVRRLADRLQDVAHEYQLTWPEFKRDPIGFIKRSATGYGQEISRFFANRNIVIAMLSAVLAMLGLVVAVRLLDRANSAGTSRFGLAAFAAVAFCLLIGLFATKLGREGGAAVMGAEPSDSQNVVLGMVVSFAVLLFIVGGGILYDSYHKKKVEEQQRNEELEVQNLIDIPQDQPTPDPGTAGFNKGKGGGSKPKQEKPGGGGGGGRQEQTPASAGKLPQASLTVPQVVAPDPHPPAIKNPSLPTPATVVADPLLVPPDARVLPYGDPKSKSTTPSSGPGVGNGIGTGTGGGVGPGEGGGIGPGRGGNIGGGDRNDGGGGPGGGGGGYDKIFSGRDVNQKARVLSKPEPQYTEDARKNQITGTVVLRAVFMSNGQVTNIRAVSGLPFGLTERAIAAARQIKFMPALKDGHPVSMYMQLEYNFNLY